MKNPVLIGVTTDELLDELCSRCSSIAVSCQYRSEGDIEHDEFTTTSRVEGNFIHVAGLVEQLGNRSKHLMEAVMGYDESDG
jgi:hypothetical protein